MSEESDGRPVRKRNPDESRRRILDAAERAFSRRGFDGARLRDIAEDAGVHHALVHHYYGDKRGLFREVLQRALSNMSMTGLERLAATKGLDESTLAIVSALCDFFAAHRDLVRIIDGALRDKQSASHELTTALLGELALPLLQGVRARLLRAQQSGHVRADVSAESLIVFSFGAIVYPFVSGPELSASFGIPRLSDAGLQAHKLELARYIVGAMRPVPGPA